MKIRKKRRFFPPGLGKSPLVNYRPGESPPIKLLPDNLPNPNLTLDDGDSPLSRGEFSGHPFLHEKKCFFKKQHAKTRTTCKISTFFEDLKFVNSIEATLMISYKKTESEYYEWTGRYYEWRDRYYEWTDEYYGWINEYCEWKNEWTNEC